LTCLNFHFPLHRKDTQVVLMHGRSYWKVVETPGVGVQYSLRIVQVFRPDRHSQVHLLLTRLRRHKDEWYKIDLGSWYWYILLPEQPLPQSAWEEAKEWIRKKTSRRAAHFLVEQAENEYLILGPDISYPDGTRKYVSHS